VYVHICIVSLGTDYILLPLFPEYDKSLLSITSHWRWFKEYRRIPIGSTERCVLLLMDFSIYGISWDQFAMGYEVVAKVLAFTGQGTGSRGSCEPKPVRKVGCVPEKAKATAGELQRSPETSSSPLR
jgi:hypothetical protein